MRCICCDLADTGGMGARWQVLEAFAEAEKEAMETLATEAMVTSGQVDNIPGSVGTCIASRMHTLFSSTSS